MANEYYKSSHTFYLYAKNKLVMLFIFVMDVLIINKPDLVEIEHIYIYIYILGENWPLFFVWTCIYVLCKHI